jgi:hypothetical protein
MPSFGLKQKLGVAVLAAAMFALSASAASANEAWVWACHGPNNATPVATAMQTGAGAGASSTANCLGDNDTGAVLRLTAATPAADTHADVGVKLPTGVTTKKIVIYNHAGAASAGVNVRVSSISDGEHPVTQVLDELPLAEVPAAYELPTSASGTLKVSLICTQAPTCAAPTSLDVVKIAVLVDDSSAPYGGVNRNTPVNASSPLIANSIEQGVGFSHGDAFIATAPSDSAIVRSQTVAIGDCADLSPGSATIDLPLDTARCLTGSQPASFLGLDTSALPEGTYYRRVVMYDAVGNTASLMAYEPFEVWHPVLGSPTQTLSIGSSAIPPGPPQTNPNQRPNTRPSSTAAACRSPRLSVSLDQKPMRVHRSVAVLQYKKRYRFEGRLTCVVNHRRISAPKRTKIQLLNTVKKKSSKSKKYHRKTVTKKGPRLGSKGRFKIYLKYPRGSRTLIFRFRNADGQRSQVSIKIKVEKKKKKSATKRR